VAKLRAKYAGRLQKDDIKPAIMGEQGSDIKLSPAAALLIPFSIECKNRERVNFRAAWEQIQKNAIREGRIPALVISWNHQNEPIWCIPESILLEMMK
jgi:hypothetical protein